MQRFQLAKMLTIHNLAWEVSLAGALVTHFVFASPFAATLLAGTGILATLTLRSITPMPIFQPCGGSYHVGIRHIPGDPYLNRPPIAAYYPTQIPPSQTELEPWLPHEGDVRYAKGLASYARLPSVVFRHFAFVGMRCTRNAAPLPLWNASTNAMRPIVVFSHGLAGHCQLYSLLAMDLAARGVIVLAPEHQDGSSCFTRDAHSADDDASIPHKPCTAACGSPQERQFREEQLEHRRREIDAVLRSLASAWLLHALCLSRQDLKDLQERCGGVPQVALAGHSFGAATAIHAAVAHAASADEVLRGVRVTSVVAFDAWHLPLQHTTLAKVRELASLHRNIIAVNSDRSVALPPLLLLESQHWQTIPASSNFQKELMTAYCAAAQDAGRRPPAGQDVQDVAQEESLGTDHMSCSDIAVLSPVFSRHHATVKPRQQITAWARRVLQHITAAPMLLLHGDDISKES